MNLKLLLGSSKKKEMKLKYSIWAEESMYAAKYNPLSVKFWEIALISLILRLDLIPLVVPNARTEFVIR
jgi:hypothetical protein